MKAFKLFLSMLMIITLLISCSYHDVTVEWDPVNVHADGTPLTGNQEARYKVFIDYDIDDNHDAPLEMTKDGPIRETKYTFHNAKAYTHARKRGHYYVGVQAVIYEHGEQVGKPSDIAWSNTKKDTNEKPFDVDIHRH